jgi:hypothetical protein
MIMTCAYNCRHGVYLVPGRGSHQQIKQPPTPTNRLEMDRVVQNQDQALVGQRRE